MSFSSWLNSFRGSSHSKLRRKQCREQRRQAFFEQLEMRRLLAFGATVDYPSGLSPRAIVSADFNRDGQLDLITPNAGDNSVTVLLGNANGTFQPALASAGGVSPVSLAVGDFDSDGNLDVAIANANSNVSIIKGRGDGTFDAPSSIELGANTNPQSVAVGDFNADGKLDLAVTSNQYDLYYYYGNSSGYYSANVDVLLGNGDGSFAASIRSSLGYGYHASAVVADFNGDSNQDFATANYDFGTVSVLFGDGTGNLSNLAEFQVGYTPSSVVAGDLNGDLKVDLVVANLLSDDISVLVGDGQGSFGLPQNYASGTTPTSVVLGDFTGDGKADIAAVNSGSNNISILRGDGNGNFPTLEKFGAGSGAFALTAGDWNRDGWLDIATANMNSNNISVQINDRYWPTPPLPSVSVSDASVIEGNSGVRNATFTITLSAVSTADVTVHFSTADITANSGADYTARLGSVVIPAGQTSATFTVAVIGDRLAEATETFAVNLSNAVNATIMDGQGIGSITDDEPQISISDVKQAEGMGKKKSVFTFTVTLSAAYDQAVTVSFATADGTATASSGDYVAKTGKLTFNPGEKTKTITVEVKGDNLKELDEYFYLDLFGNSSNSLFTKSRGTGTILNDDK